MIQRLGEVVPDLGRDTAGDSTSLESAADGGATAPRPQRRMGTQAEAVPASPAGDKPEKIELDRHGLPQPSGGRKEYKDDKGNVTKVVAWFGYKLHLLVDAKHEVALVWRVSSTKAGDNELLPELVDQARANLPKGRMQTLAYDKAADTVDAHEKLHACGIKAVIQNRALWKEEQEKLLPGHDGNSNVVYDEAGTLHCYDRVSTPMIRRPMAYIGHEPSRGTLKYRCPAKHSGLPCAMSEICNAGKRLRVDGPRETRDRPAAFSADSAGHQAVRAALQGPHERGAGQRAVEDLLGHRRRQRHRRHAVSCDGGRGDDRTCGLCHALGRRAAAGRDAGQDAAEPDCQGPSRADYGGEGQALPA